MRSSRSTSTRPACERRFLEKVVKNADTGCWEWQGFVTPAGYGHFRYDSSKVGLAHRWSYEHWVGSVPEGMEVDHACENRRCVNPNHLRVMGARGNTVRNASPPARNFHKTECDAGHPLSGDNLSVDSRGYRVCKECARDRQRRFRDRRAAQDRAAAGPR